MQHARLVGQTKQLSEMQQRTRTLVTPDHHEVVLQSVEPSQEHHAGLVETCRTLEDVARERDGRLQDAVKTLQVAGRKPREPG